MTAERFIGPSGEVVTTDGSRQGTEFLEAYRNACSEHEAALSAWRSVLREKGVFITSPDDGWVNRTKNEWTPPSYAYIRGPLEIGAIVALGTPGSYRLVRITAIKDWLIRNYQFAPLEALEWKPK